jgi:hypothetical protein
LFRETDVRGLAVLGLLVEPSTEVVGLFGLELSCTLDRVDSFARHAPVLLGQPSDLVRRRDAGSQVDDVTVVLVVLIEDVLDPFDGITVDIRRGRYTGIPGAHVNEYLEHAVALRLGAWGASAAE